MVESRNLKALTPCPYPSDGLRVEPLFDAIGRSPPQMCDIVFIDRSRAQPPLHLDLRFARCHTAPQLNKMSQWNYGRYIGPLGDGGARGVAADPLLSVYTADGIGRPLTEAFALYVRRKWVWRALFYGAHGNRLFCQYVRERGLEPGLPDSCTAEQLSRFDAEIVEAEGTVTDAATATAVAAALRRVLRALPGPVDAGTLSAAVGQSEGLLNRLDTQQAAVRRLSQLRAHKDRYELHLAFERISNGHVEYLTPRSFARRWYPDGVVSRVHASASSALGAHLAVVLQGSTPCYPYTADAEHNAVANAYAVQVNNGPVHAIVYSPLEYLPTLARFRCHMAGCTDRESAAAFREVEKRLRTSSEVSGTWRGKRAPAGGAGGNGLRVYSYPQRDTAVPFPGHHAGLLYRVLLADPRAQSYYGGAHPSSGWVEFLRAWFEVLGLGLGLGLTSAGQPRGHRGALRHCAELRPTYEHYKMFPYYKRLGGRLREKFQKRLELVARRHGTTPSRLKAVIKEGVDTYPDLLAQSPPRGTAALRELFGPALDVGNDTNFHLGLMMGVLDVLNNYVVVQRMGGGGGPFISYSTRTAGAVRSRTEMLLAQCAIKESVATKHTERARHSRPRMQYPPLARGKQLRVRNPQRLVFVRCGSSIV